MPKPGRLTFLIDTNVFVTLEPFGLIQSSEPFDEAALFQRRVHEHGHRMLLHSGTRESIDRDTNVARREQNLQALNKYVVLTNIPGAPRTVAMQRLVASIHSNA